MASLPRREGIASKGKTAVLERPRRGRWWTWRVICSTVLCACLLFLFLFSFSSHLLHPMTTFPPPPREVCEMHRVPGETFSGFLETPVVSTVLMLYSPNAAAGRFCYSSIMGANGTAEQEFSRVAASYVSSPHNGPSSPYYDFFSAHDATLWTLDNATAVATPLRLDVVYTFVNPSAPSFKRNLEARGVPYEHRRYRDWEELRYSLRSLHEFVLGNAALAQYHRRHVEDVERLHELGYRVNVSADGVDDVTSLVRRVYLVLSDKDHVPAWLNVERFPELRIVTHAEMFSAAEATWVLPTLNSNVIESGLHRIPGISRFFLYIANDMLVGRQVSLFDLFRPLSPPRQRLHLYKANRRGFDTSDPVTMQHQGGRAALFLEPVMHSDTQYMDPRGGMTDSERRSVMRARHEIGQCMIHEARTAIEEGSAKGASVKTITLPSWSTTEAFALHDIRYGATPRGGGVRSEYYYHLSSIRLHGIQLPYGYAHIPQLVDREVYRRMNEVELFDLTNATRAAYEREMHPYSPIDEYAVFAVAMMRGAERHVWSSIWREGTAGVFEDVWVMLATWWTQHVLTDPGAVVQKLSQRSLTHADESWFGSLYGDTLGAQLQRPNLPVEMAFWWLKGAVKLPRRRRGLKQLKRLYTIPEVAMDATCRSRSPKWSARSDDHYHSLLDDIFHHTKRDTTFLFEMIENDMKAFLLAARLQYEWVQRPLFMGFNDNFPADTNFTVSKRIFNTLLSIVSHDCIPAPWEWAPRSKT